MLHVYFPAYKFVLIFHFYVICFFLLTSSCSDPGEQILPDVITQPVRYDTDDPAIWVNRQNPMESIVFGTDKNTDGAIYAFDLNGQVLEDKVIRDVRRPNNIDVEYGLNIGGQRVDIIAFTEREMQRVRVFSVPDMQALDQGGFNVFEREPEGDFRLPMGIALFAHPEKDSVYIIVGRKNGPTDGTYLWQYLISPDSTQVHYTLVRKFGNFSGQKEIEAVAVDDEAGYVYYADEGVGIRKYHADPELGNEELALFGTEGFKDDMEGIGIHYTDNMNGFIGVSDQGANTIRLFSRIAPHSFVKSVKYRAKDTDGLDISSFSFGDKFPHGLLVAMSDDKTFHYYSLDKLELE